MPLTVTHLPSCQLSLFKGSATTSYLSIVIIDPPSKLAFNKTYKDKFASYDKKETLFVFIPAACRMSLDVYKEQANLTEYIIRSSSKQMKQVFVPLLQSDTPLAQLQFQQSLQEIAKRIKMSAEHYLNWLIPQSVSKLILA